MYFGGSCNKDSISSSFIKVNRRQDFHQRDPKQTNKSDGLPPPSGKFPKFSRNLVFYLSN